MHKNHHVGWGSFLLNILCQCLYNFATLHELTNQYHIEAEAVLTLFSLLVVRACQNGLYTSNLLANGTQDVHMQHTAEVTVVHTSHDCPT